MIISCDKCGPNNEGKLDPSTNEVICMSCRKKGNHTVIPMTPFFVEMMRSRHDIIDESDQIRIPPNGMLTTCDNNKCQKSFSAEVSPDNAVYCPYCKTKANISFIAISMLKSNGIVFGATKSYFYQEGKEAVSVKEDATNMAKLAAIARARGQLAPAPSPVPEPTEAELKVLGDVFEGPDPALIARNAVRAAELGQAALLKGKTAPAFKRADS